MSGYNRDYYLRNKQRLIAKSKAYRETNLEKARGYSRKSHYLRYKRLRAEALEHLGAKCKECGFSDPRALQIDHVRGGGVKETRGVHSYKYFIQVVEDNTGAYQLLCANCNWIKRAENQEKGGYKESW